MSARLLTLEVWRNFDESTRDRWTDVLEGFGILPLFTYEVDLDAFTGDFIAYQYHQLPGVGLHLRSRCHWWAKFLRKDVCRVKLTIPNPGRMSAV